MGSVDNAAFARSALTSLRFPEIPSIKVLLHSKTNCGPYGKTIAYRISGQRIDWMDEDDISEIPSLVKYIQKYSLSEDDLSIDTENANASETMIHLLSGGPIERNDRKRLISRR